LINIQESSPPSSREVHPNEYEVRQTFQEACVNEQGAPGQADKKESIQRVEARTDNLRGTQKRSPSI